MTVKVVVSIEQHSWAAVVALMIYYRSALAGSKLNVPKRCLPQICRDGGRREFQADVNGGYRNKAGL
jgi:hypothetical protein